MSAIEEIIPLPCTALSLAAPHRSSLPPPLWALSAAERAIALPRRAAERRNRALQPVLRRPPARNPVAADRLFRAVTTALGSDPVPERLPGDRHTALECRAFGPAATPGLDPAGPEGLSLRRLVVLAGKHLDWRFTSTVLHVTHHAAVRFAERSRRTAPEDLAAAATEAAGVADAVLLGHLDGPLAERLAGGSAAILLPAGPSSAVACQPASTRLSRQPSSRRAVAKGSVAKERCQNRAGPSAAVSFARHSARRRTAGTAEATRPSAVSTTRISPAGPVTMPPACAAAPLVVSGQA
ncbi:hypothetical protein [Roseomonas rosulenta]|uniref:hypothetical protein n=1 Tax=Roseomonas rosulenta TaxID=2748667 RepID=UPI0018DF1B9F|nr:hypothetical protein [Roseomonas rosulenta]